MPAKTVEIKIYYDRDFNFYVVKTTVVRKPLPKLISMNSSDRERLAAAYPSRGADIMRAVVGTNFARTEIEPLIEEFNRECERSNVTRKYRVTKNYTIERINSSDRAQMPTAGLIEADYGSSSDSSDIIAFIKELEKELKRETYGVFTCPVCKKIQYAPVIKKRVICCGKQFDEGICVAVYSSDNSDAPLTAAVAKCHELQMKRDAQNDTDDDITVEGLHPFTYKDVTYRVNAHDCLLLHKTLYEDFAFDVVFEVKKDGSVGFTDDFLKYLKSLRDNRYCAELYDSVRRIKAEINSRENAIASLEKAFYWYVKNYALKGEKTLIWRFASQPNSEAYKFASAKAYAEAFVAANADERARLRLLFNDLTCNENELFDGYEPNDASEFSRLIYFNAGRFIYASADGYVDFGDDLIGQLNAQDDLIAVRNLFLESIKGNYKFWDKIKKSFDELSDNGFISEDENYYDRLCFYQFAITGKKTLKFKTLSIKNSQDGFNKIKTVIRDAYVKGNQTVLEQFRILVELAKHRDLCDRLDKLAPVTQTVTFNSGRESENITFATLRTKLVSQTRERPSMELYLLCSDLSGNAHKQLEIRFDGRMKTFCGHLKYMLDTYRGKALIDAVKKFYADEDVAFFTKYVLDRKVAGGSEKFHREHKEGFDKLIEANDALRKRYSDLRHSVMNSEMRGGAR